MSSPVAEVIAERAADAAWIASLKARCSVRPASTASMPAPVSTRACRSADGAHLARIATRGAEVLRFPPVMSRAPARAARLPEELPQPARLRLRACTATRPTSAARSAASSRVATWTTSLAAADLVLAPAACYPVYPLAAERGAVPDGGLTFDVAGDCFRREPSRRHRPPAIVPHARIRAHRLARRRSRRSARSGSSARSGIAAELGLPSASTRPTTLSSAASAR